MQAAIASITASTANWITTMRDTAVYDDDSGDRNGPTVGAVYDRAFFPAINKIRAVIDRAYSKGGFATVSLISRVLANMNQSAKPTTTPTVSQRTATSSTAAVKVGHSNRNCLRISARS